MKRYPHGTAANKTPSLFVTGFKLAAGAYLGWNIMLGFDRGFARAIFKKVGDPDVLIAKIEDWGKRQRENI